MSLSILRDLIADDSYAISFQTLGQYRSALLKELDSQEQDTRTDDEILRFLDNWGFIDGELEQNEDGTLRWAYSRELNRYDGDDDWEEMDATDTILGLVRWIREPSFLGPIPEPVPFRFPLKHPASGTYVEACDRLRKHWVVRVGSNYLNKEGMWEKPNSVTCVEFFKKFSWSTAKEASSAYYNIPRLLTVEQQQAARIAELENLLKSGVQP
jgi:hypothetical protein